MRPRRSRAASHDGTWVVRPQAEDHRLLCLTGSVPGRRLLVAGAARVHHRRRAVSGIGGPDGVVQPRPPSRRDRVHLHAPDRDGSDPRDRHQPLWPDMAERAFSGTIMSSIFMAGAVVQVFGMGADRGLPRAYSAAISVLFAVNPMIVFYGSNGMSEAPFIFLMSWAVRRLIMWMLDDDVHHLIVAGGIAMGLAYLTRYDAVACIAAAGLLVGVTTYLRARPAPRFRRALVDLLMVSGPGFAAFIGWAAVSWLITGQAFAQFTSQYGNTAILGQSGQTKPDFGAGLVFAAACISLLAPTLVPIAVWGTVRRWRRPNWQLLLVPATIYGAALAFQAYSYASGSTFPCLRFYIIAIPLTACLAMLAVPEGQLIATTRRGNYAPPQQPPDIVRRRRAAYLPVAAAVA